MTVRCWNIETMNCQAIIFDYNSPIIDLDFSKNGQKLISCDEDGDIILH